MSNLRSEPRWLQGYASEKYKWSISTQEPVLTYSRPLGIVEGLFDVDGTHFEGRADLNIILRVGLRTNLDEDQTLQRVLDAWCVLRQKHILLSSIASKENGGTLEQSSIGTDKAFTFQPCANVQDLFRSGREHVISIAKQPSDVDISDFYYHLMNTSRTIDPSKALSRLFVLPLRSIRNDALELNLIMVAAHQIADGLTVFRWMSDFVHLLNLSNTQLKSMAKQLATSNPASRLPPAQEALYPAIQGSQARRRWFWLLARILRHTQLPLPTAFQNPLRRQQPLTQAQPMHTKYSEYLSYDHVPPLNAVTLHPELSSAATSNIRRLCREAKISVGSALFALVAMTMMEMEEKNNPKTPLAERLPFVGSFPVNIRPFLSGAPTAGKENSLMLGFSSGISLPFLPSYLNLEGRFRLLGRQAHRQLKQYQKRQRSVQEELSLGVRNSSQLLPSLYMSTLERLESKKASNTTNGLDIQGMYPVTVNPSLATCGISSVGDMSSLIGTGMYDLSAFDERNADFVADFRDLKSTVRPRDGEFLVGAYGNKDRISFLISYDGCAIDPLKAEQWQSVLQQLMEPVQKQEHKL